MRVSALGEAVTHLPWLSPSASTLVALARPPSAACWDRIRFDPGGVLLLLRQRGSRPTVPTPNAFPISLHDPALLEETVRVLDQGHAGFVDWNQAALRPIYLAGLIQARLAEFIARQTEAADPESAWVAGFLAPLGWYAVCAVDPEKATECFHHPEFSTDPAGTQKSLWGYDCAAIARRLWGRWGMPSWLGAICGHLELPVEAAEKLRADPLLFQIVQLAVGLAQNQGCGLHLAVGTPPETVAAALGFSTASLQEIEQALGGMRELPPPDLQWQAPAQMPLLGDLLLMAAANRRLSESPVVADLEREIDHLHQALHDQYAGEAQRLRAAKLSSLAEFAGGAGHEINNPLAVISGQAQYLLNHEPDSSRQRALQTIIVQTHRIHVILNELMYFARPPRLQKQNLEMVNLVKEVTTSLMDLAESRGVQLTCSHPDFPVSFYGDSRQIHMAAACLLRNAIEAAPAEGWARVRLDIIGSDRLELVVEDNGPGPTPLQREHMFDPFFSGRQAGRGRGLGLPTAWRLIREHGGDVRFQEFPQGPTRFILTLPWDGRQLSSAEPRLDVNGHLQNPAAVEMVPS
ncbi:MAG TPA: ATP-binding protein [Gemmataceae bacterium]|nr:ATP-binding protein [Gemmataceae bacterium]